MKPLIFLFVVLWLTVAVSGTVYLSRFENTPAEQSAYYPAIFPPESRLELDPVRPTLIFFAHPKCPCTRASLHELARLMANTDGKVKAYVVFIKPAGASEHWTDTDLRTEAEAMSNVQVIIDEESRESNIFHAQTSSLTLLYDRDGKLRFNGGITASRGHEGDNAGSRKIFEIVTSADDMTGEWFVFGCPLHEENCTGELIKAAN
jgi:hypothetical protein